MSCNVKNTGSSQHMNTCVLLFIHVCIFFWSRCSCLCIRDNRRLWPVAHVLASFVPSFFPEALRCPRQVFTWVTCSATRVFCHLYVLMLLDGRREGCRGEVLAHSVRPWRSGKRKHVLWKWVVEEMSLDYWGLPFVRSDCIFQWNRYEGNDRCFSTMV